MCEKRSFAVPLVGAAIALSGEPAVVPLQGRGFPAFVPIARDPPRSLFSRIRRTESGSRGGLCDDDLLATVRPASAGRHFGVRFSSSKRDRERGPRAPDGR